MFSFMHDLTRTGFILVSLGFIIIFLVLASLGWIFLPNSFKSTITFKGTYTMIRIGLVIEAIIFTAIFFLTGCSSAPKERIITKTEVSVIKTPQSLLIPCDATAPPVKEVYLKSTMQEKEALLADLSNNLYRDLNICSSRIKSIKDFQEKEVKNIESARGQ